VLARPWTTLAIALLVTLLLGWRLPRLQVNNTPEVWLPSGSKGLQDLNKFRERFGEDSPLLAYVTGDQLAAREADWSKLVAQLHAVPGIASVLAPPFVDPDAAGPPIPLRYYLASEDGKYAALALLPQTGLAAVERAKLVDRLETVLAPWQYRIGRFQLAGTDVVTRDLDKGSRSSLAAFAPLVLGAMCVVLYVATREWMAVTVSVFAILLADIWSLGILSWAGESLNLIVVTMPAILAVTTMTQAMHLLSYYHDLAQPAGPADYRMRAGWWWIAVKSTFLPNFYCAISTAAGFASLGTSQIPPVKVMGLITAAGVMLSFGLCYTLVPALLSLSSRVLPRGAGAHPWWTLELSKGYVSWLERRWTAIVGVAVVCFLLALGGLRLLRAESHVLELFSPGDRIPVNYYAIEKHLLGLTPIEVVVEGDPRTLLTNATLESYRSLLEQTLAEEPLVRQVVSILLEPTRGRKLEFAIQPAELREALASEGLPEGAVAFLRVENGRYLVRTTLLATTNSSNVCQALVDRLRTRIAKRIPAGVSAYVTGSSTLLIEGQVLLLRTQIWSFASAFAAIALIILLAFRSLPLALLALPPNVVPLAITLGMMGFSRIPLNTATVTVAGIALGLLVDDTIHILFRWLQQRRLGKDTTAALTKALLQIGNPAVMTSVSFGVGFGMFAFAPFRPTAYFGLLIAITAFTGMLCDVVLFPALLLRMKKPPRDRKRPFLGTRNALPYFGGGGDHAKND
jgi:predicted RND superfamily exporter protein